MTTTQPNETQPQTALDLWNVQTQALVNPALADAAIEAIYQNLMGLHDKLKAGGNDKAAAKVEEAYNQSLMIYNMTTQQAAVIDGGAAAITETDAQRQQAVAELQQILKAIDEGDTNHPKLESFASQIQEDAEMWAEDAMYEGMNETLSENIMEAWGLGWAESNAVLDAIMDKTNLTERQKALFLAFAASITNDESGDEEDPDADGAE